MTGIAGLRVDGQDLLSLREFDLLALLLEVAIERDLLAELMHLPPRLTYAMDAASAPRIANTVAEKQRS